MDDYAGRVLADRYRLPLPPSDEYELTESRAFDTYSGQEVLVRQVPLPEVVEAEVLDADGLPDGFTARDRGSRRPSAARAATRRPTDPAVRRAVEAAQAAARIPDHPRLDQVFDVFAEGGSLWVVSEWVEARPLSVLLTERPLTPYRAAEVASDVLMALRVLHAHGWVHRNLTARTVLVCDDGRVMLTGLAVGAAEEALSGYDPVPAADEPEGTGRQGPVGPQDPTGPQDSARPQGFSGPQGSTGPGGFAGQGRFSGPGGPGGRPAPGAEGTDGTGTPGTRRSPAMETGDDIRAARAGAIAAYRAGARAAARVQEAQQNGRAALPGARPPAEDDTGATAGATTGCLAPAPYTPEQDGARQGGATSPGQTADPYGVRTTPWHGVSPRGGQDEDPQRPALAPGGVSAGSPAQGTPHAPGTEGGPAPALPPTLSERPLPDGRPLPGGRPLAGGRPPADGRPFPDVGVPAQGGGHTLVPPGGALQPRPAARSPRPPAHFGDPSVGSRPPAHGDDPSVSSPPPAHFGDPSVGSPPPAHWGAPAAAGRGPATALAAERARQVRMTVVGPVTERWAPEQAGPVHENWQLAAPIGPATDLWGLGALLFRAVQGHAPYPEESAAELVQLVCAEPPAFAEECGPLRPVVESLLRQDPTERPDFEELAGWLRSLVRSAPEPDAGTHVVPAPPVDPARLPIVRRRGELVRRRRAGLPANSLHGRHKRAREQTGSPRRLGRNLLLLVLLLVAGGIAYAMLFMPKSGTTGALEGDRTGTAGQASRTTASSGGSGTAPSAGVSEESSSAPSPETQTTAGTSVADGFTLRKDPDGFQIAVADGWDRTPRNSRAQVVYTHGDFQLIVVPGRDSAAQYGSDPMVYQRDKESELQPYRDSSWATAAGLRTIEVGGRTMAEGQFTWTDDQGRDLFVRNIAILIDGRYHVVQVRGPESQRDEVTTLYEQASQTYKFTR